MSFLLFGGVREAKRTRAGSRFGCSFALSSRLARGCARAPSSRSLGLAVIAGGVATAVALVPTWLPQDASREARPHRLHFWFVIAICIAIFAIVAAVMIYAVIRFRVPDDDFEDGPRSTGTRGSRSCGRRFPSSSSPPSRS